MHITHASIEFTSFYWVLRTEGGGEGKGGWGKWEDEPGPG